MIIETRTYIFRVLAHITQPPECLMGAFVEQMADECVQQFTSKQKEWTAMLQQPCTMSPIIDSAFNIFKEVTSNDWPSSS